MHASTGIRGDILRVALLLGILLSAWQAVPGARASQSPATLWALAKSTTQLLVGVAFVDDQHGWVVGDAGTILHTDDGGVTWKAQASHTDAVLRYVTFVDRRHGWAVGVAGTILHTDDGGATWAAQKSGTTELLEGVAFADSRNGWAVGGSGMPDPAMLHTTNGGGTWQAQATGVGQLDSVTTAGAGGWAVGLSVMHTTNITTGTWTVKDIAGTDSDFYRVVFRDARHGWILRTGGSILRTTDGGSTWHGTLAINAELTSIAFPDVRRGWAVGMAGVIMHTSDGGATWSRQPSGPATVLWGVACVDASHCWAVGAGETDGGRILHYVGQ